MAIIGLNDPTGLGSVTDATSDNHKLLNGTGFTYTAGSGQEVFRFGFQPGNGTTYASLQIGLYNVTSGASGAALVASATVTAVAANTATTTDITPVSLTNGNIYAVGWRVISTGTMNRVFQSNACRTSTLTGSSALGSTWSDSANLSQKYAIWAETQNSGPLVNLAGITTTSSQGSVSVQITDAPTVTGQAITSSAGTLTAVPVNSGTSGLGSAVIDFLAGNEEATVTVLGQTNIQPGSFVEGFIMGTDSTADNNQSDHSDLDLNIRCTAIDTGAGSFTLKATSAVPLTGKYLCRWVWTH